MRIFHFYTSQHLHRSLHTDFWLFEYAIWLHAVGRALIAVFVPLILARSGFPFEYIILYYFVFNVLDVPFNFLMEHVVMWMGARKTVIFATLVSIAYFLLLGRLAHGNLWFLLGLAALDAVYDTSYWVAHVYLFLKSSESEAGAGRQTGILYAVRTLAAALGPLIGAMILLFGNSGWLIWASVSFFALSLIPLFRLRHTADHPRHDGMHLREFFAEPLERRNYLITFLTSIHSAAEGILWPLFIYYLFGTTASVAYVAIALSLSAAAFSYATGLIQERGRTKVMVSGAILAAGVWLLRMTGAGSAVYFGSVTAMGFFLLLVSVPLDSSLYARARQGASLRAATFRNAVSMSGYLLVFTVLLLFRHTFAPAFILAPLALLGIAATVLHYSRAPQ